MPDRRLVRAFLLAPLVAPLGYWLGAIGWGVARSLQGQAQLPSATSVVTMLGLTLAAGAPPAYATALVGGVPLYFVLRHTHWMRRAVVLPLGAVLGATTAVLMAPQLRGDLFSIPLPPWAGAALGLASAEAFWRLRRGTDEERPGTRAPAAP